MDERPLPLCREADKCLTVCPRCQRTMQARWLRYSHRCGNSWDLDAREQDAVDKAHEAFCRREASSNSAPGPKYGQQNAQQNTDAKRDAKKDYKKLFAGKLGGQN